MRIEEHKKIRKPRFVWFPQKCENCEAEIWLEYADTYWWGMFREYKGIVCKKCKPLPANEGE
jgi:hypothetical protein